MQNRGALDLLSAYASSEDEDDIVPGPRVSTKRSFRADEDTEERRKKLPVPDIVIKSSENSISTPIDNPDVHGGRKRSFAHERGNWATYVYIPFENHSGIQDLVCNIQKSVHGIKLEPVDNFHISLTRTLILRHHWIEPFMQKIRQEICSTRKFVVMFDELQIYCNEECTRTFIGLQIKIGYQSLLNMVQIMDNCLEEFKLPGFYKDPSFHMSVVWCAGDKVDELKSEIHLLNESLKNAIRGNSEEHWYIVVDEICCKTGNKLFSFKLI